MKQSRDCTIIGGEDATADKLWICHQVTWHCKLDNPGEGDLTVDAHLLPSNQAMVASSRGLGSTVEPGSGTVAR